MMLRRHLAEAAKRELAAREKHYPAMVEAGRLGREEAQAEMAAWRVIATLFAEGSCETELSWTALAETTAGALQRREEALAAKPDDQALLARRDAVSGINERIVYHRDLIDGLNAKFRAHADRESIAA
jgi:hypothetical protein